MTYRQQLLLKPPVMCQLTRTDPTSGVGMRHYRVPIRSIPLGLGLYTINRHGDDWRRGFRR